MNPLTITNRDLESELAEHLAEQIREDIDLEILAAMGVDTSVQPEDIRVFIEKLDPSWSRIVSHIRVRDFHLIESEIRPYLVPNRGTKYKLKGHYLFGFVSDDEAMYWRIRI